MENTGETFIQLPKEIVILIIAYLPVLDAINLCSLKRDWVDLWINKSAIEVDESDFMDVEERLRIVGLDQRERASQIKEAGKRRFVEFVNWMIHRLAAPVISKFSLRVCYVPMYHHLITQWINFAVSRDVVQVLMLNFSDGDPIQTFPPFYRPRFTLPRFLYDHCGSIQKLLLNSCNLGPFINFRNFSSLTDLSLIRIELSFEDVVVLLRNCPVLKALVLIECRRLLMLEISSPGLKLERLVVRDCEPLSLGINLRAPRLQYFEYSGCSMTVDITNLDNLSEVVLDYGLDTYFPDQATVFREILWGCYRVKVLTLCSYVFKVLPSDSYLFYEPPLQLINLEHLTLKVGLNDYELLGIFFLLGSSPNLQTLSIRIGFSGAVNELMDPPMPFEYWKWMPRLPLAHLDMIKVEGFTGSENEMDLLGFLLKNARLLGKLIIIPKQGMPTRSTRGISWLYSWKIEALLAESASQRLKVPRGAFESEEIMIFVKGFN